WNERRGNERPTATDHRPTDGRGDRGDQDPDGRGVQARPVDRRLRQVQRGAPLPRRAPALVLAGRQLPPARGEHLQLRVATVRQGGASTTTTTPRRPWRTCARRTPRSWMGTTRERGGHCEPGQAA